MGQSTLQATMEYKSIKAAMFINNRSKEVENQMNKMLNGKQPHHLHGDANGSDNAQVEKRSGNHIAGSNMSPSFFAQDSTQAGNANSDNQKRNGLNFAGMLGAMSGYPLGLGMGGGGGNHNSNAATKTGGNSNSIYSLQNPEMYREFCKNMSNSFPGLGTCPPRGGMGPPPSSGNQGHMPEEFQWMMLAKAMGQSGWTHNPGMHHGMLHGKKDQGRCVCIL